MRPKKDIDKDFIGIIDLLHNRSKKHPKAFPKAGEIKKEVMRLYDVSESWFFKKLRQLKENDKIDKKNGRYFVITDIYQLKERKEYLKNLEKKLQDTIKKNPWKIYHEKYPNQWPKSNVFETIVKSEIDDTKNSFFMNDLFNSTQISFSDDFALRNNLFYEKKKAFINLLFQTISESEKISMLREFLKKE